MRYFEQPPPRGNGLCSYPPCPCDEVTISPGQGYLYIPEECVEFRRDARSIEDANKKLDEMGRRGGYVIIPGHGVVAPILLCERAARLLQLDFDVAATDARRWWETGQVPLRPTPGKSSAPDVPATVDGCLCFTGHAERVIGVAISGDGARALSCGYDSTVRLLDAKTAKEIHCFNRHYQFVCTVAFSPDGRRAISGGADRTVRVWDIEKRREIRHQRKHSFTIFSSAISRDGRLALSGSGDGTVRLWDVGRGVQIRRFGGFFREKGTTTVFAVAISPDGHWALSGGLESGAIRLWDVETGKEIRRFGQVLPTGGMAFLPDGRRALTCSGDGTVRIWDLTTGREIGRFNHDVKVELFYSRDWPFDKISRFALSSNGRRLLCDTDNSGLCLFDFESGRLLRRLKGHTRSVTSLALSDDGQYAVTGSDDWTVRLWQL